MKHLKPENMVLTRLNILQHVPTTLDIDQEGQNILVDHGISLLRKLLNSTDEAYQYLMDK